MKLRTVKDLRSSVFGVMGSGSLLRLFWFLGFRVGSLKKICFVVPDTKAIFTDKQAPPKHNRRIQHTPTQRQRIIKHHKNLEILRP